MHRERLESAMPLLVNDDAILLSLWCYWDSRRGSWPILRESDIGLESIRDLLPHIQFVERHGDRFWYRTSGSMIGDVYGQSLAGRYVDELPPNMRDNENRHYRRGFETARPVLARDRCRYASAVEVALRRIVLPLADRDGYVGVLLVGQTSRPVSALPPLAGAPLDNFVTVQAELV